MTSLRRYNQLDQFTFHHVIAESAGVSLVFFTKQGCKSCGAWRQQLQLLSTKRLDVRLFEVDAEREQGLAREFEIFHLPALYVFKNGQFYGELQSEARLAAIQETLNTLLSGPPQEMP